MAPKTLGMKNFLLNGKAVPRWIILLIDFVITSWSFALSYFVIKEFEFTGIQRGHFFIYMGLYCMIALAVFYFMRVHTGLIRYSNTQDMLRIFGAVLLTSIIYWGWINLFIVPVYEIHTLNINLVLMVNFFIASSLLIMLRIVVKGIYFYIKRVASPDKIRVLIYGTDRNAILVKQALEASEKDRFMVSGFIDIDRNKINSYIERKKVYHIKDLPRLQERSRVDRLVVMNEHLDKRAKKVAIERSLQLGLKVVTVPPSDQWIYGRLSRNQIQDLRIEDLLQRDPIVIHNNQIQEELTGKRILITGAAGSIGSEIVRQVLNYQPELVILCDRAESPLHEIQLEIEERFQGTPVRTFIGDVTNWERMLNLFQEYTPQVIFHAAAYKHVPMMEHNPTEAILTNVKGTKTIADLAIVFNTEKFVMISTDKAVNPTNVMGASKRIAEIYIQSLNDLHNNAIRDIARVNGVSMNGSMNITTKFVTTRFGNVLGSNGSVIPRFSAQIEKGGPVTVTHPEITRYFMTIPEAVQLVLEAGTMGKGGEIYIFDMGKPVRIVDLAKKMIGLAGLQPGKDIEIVYTGLRPGEKLYEELLNKAELTMPTHHEKIKISRVITYSYQEVEAKINQLLVTGKEYDLVKKMKKIVPEYKSNNSVYEKLDVVN